MTVAEWIAARRTDDTYMEWSVCEACGGIGEDENANFWCGECHAQGGRWSSAMLDVIEAAAILAQRDSGFDSESCGIHDCAVCNLNVALAKLTEAKP